MNQLQFGMPQVFPPFGLPPIRNPQPSIQLAPPLYVGDLDENIREEALYDLFSKFGQIYYIRLMRDPATGNSRGFAYVNFVIPREAENAMALAQGEKLGRKHIRIMFKRQNIKSLDGNVFVKNVDKNATIKELLNFIQMKFVDKQPPLNPAPRILSAKLAVNNQGECLGYGYVQFESKDQAEIAIQTLNGLKFKEQIIDVSHFKPRSERPSKKKSNLYIKQLPDLDEEVLKEKVKEVFSQFGDIDQMVTRKDSNIGKFFACVCYTKPEDALSAIEHLHNNSDNPLSNALPPNEKIGLYVNYFQSKQERAEQKANNKANSNNANNIFMKNLKPEVNKDQVKELFQQYGEVINTGTKKWENAQNTRNLQMGFVAFRVIEDATKAKNEAAENENIRKLFADDKPFLTTFQTKPQRSKFLQTTFRSKNLMPQPAFPFAANHDMQRNVHNPIRRLPNFFPYVLPNPLQGGSVPGQMPRGGMGQSINKRPQNNNRMSQQPYPNRGGPRPNQGGMMSNRGMDVNRRGPGPQERNLDRQSQPQQSSIPRQAQGGHKQEQLIPTKPQQTNSLEQQGNKPLLASGPIGSGSTSSLTVADLKNKWNEFIKLDKEKQRNILGELLFPLIKSRVGDHLAPKITGMLIDLDVLEISEIFEFLEEPDLLYERIEEAKNLIESESQ